MICVSVAIGLGLAGLIMRTRLVVTSEGLADHRIFRVIHIPWEQITGFEIVRPSGPWGGFCVVAVSRNGSDYRPARYAGVLADSFRPAR